jgi:GntR family transcriptional regulator
VKGPIDTGIVAQLNLPRKLDGYIGIRMATQLLQTDYREAPRAPQISLDRNSFVPYYRQVGDQIRALIQEEKLPVGRAFCSEGDLARQLGISKMTVRQAFQSLRLEGLLLIEKGKRPIIGAGRVRKNVQELRGFSEEMCRRGLRPSSKLLSIRTTLPDGEASGALRLGDGARVYWIQRLRYAGNQLVGLEISQLPASFFPHLEKHNLERTSLYSVLETAYGVKLDWSEEQLEAVPAEKEEAKLLHVSAGTPLFFVRRTVYTAEDVPIEYCRSRFRGDRYAATVMSHRGASGSAPK